MVNKWRRGFRKCGRAQRQVSFISLNNLIATFTILVRVLLFDHLSSMVGRMEWKDHDE